MSSEFMITYFAFIISWVFGFFVGKIKGENDSFIFYQNMYHDLVNRYNYKIDSFEKKCNDFH